MTEEQIDNAFYALGAVFGFIASIDLGNNICPANKAIIDKSMTNILDFMKEGSKAIRELRSESVFY
jgi:hypothetical protein